MTPVIIDKGEMATWYFWREDIFDSFPRDQR